MKDKEKSAEEITPEENMVAETPSLYPPPYKIVNGGLCVECMTNQGKYDKKLCNFLPRLAAEITVDDGLTETKRLRIVGEHAGGYALPEIEIVGSEFTTFNWLLEHWGVDCNLEPGSGVREHIRYAIQSTAPQAERKSIYTVTGWKKISGKWRYLMPGEETASVQLPGKLKRYEMKAGYTPTDIGAAFCLLEMPVAPKEIVFPLLAFTFLSPLNEFLHRANCEPKFVLFLLGKTGTRKSTLAALFLSFFGSFTASDLPLSFRDTANSIIHHTFALKDVLTCIDDFHPCGKQEESKLTATAQAVMRAYGDRTGRGRLKSDTSKINHIRKLLPEDEHYRHENFVPAIISKEIWEQAQFLLKDKLKRNVRAGSGKPCHRYTGLIKCGDCGSSFVCKTRKWPYYPDRIEYTCNGNHRYGNEHCTPHRIDEKTLDKLIYDELMLIKNCTKENFKSIEKDMKKWLSGKNTAKNKIKKLTAKLEQRKTDQQEILLERIRDKAHADAYTDMLQKCETDIKNLTAEIASITDYDSTIKKAAQGDEAQYRFN